MILNKISLRARIFSNLIVLLGIILGGGLVMIWYTYSIEALFTNLIDKDVGALRAVEALESDLANQKGLVSYYFLDGDSEWLSQLNRYRQNFKTELAKAKQYIFSDIDKGYIEQIEFEYNSYIKIKDHVIKLFIAQKKEEALQGNKDARLQFFKIMDLLTQYKTFCEARINSTQNESRTQAERLRVIAVTAMSIAVILSVTLTIILMTQILDPLRKLALETDRSGEWGKPENEVVALSHQVRGLIKDMEKFALVGNLAAGVAHSIRNPLTSVKMRLFSLERNLELSLTQKEDFAVVSEEIRHIDTIVQNFLEFSRPPKLKMQMVSPSDIVDNALQLLRHRVEAYEVTITVNRRKKLPEILADPEQLKEVMVNLIVNACEAMVSGGSIMISEEDIEKKDMGRMLVLTLSDNGPGIPTSIQEKVFQPFFSCKEEGTGLGLTIAERIVTEHGGWLDLQSREGEGATFIINLPIGKGEQ